MFGGGHFFGGHFGGTFFVGGKFPLAGDVPGHGRKKPIVNAGLTSTVTSAPSSAGVATHGT